MLVKNMSRKNILGAFLSHAALLPFLATLCIVVDFLQMVDGLYNRLYRGQVGLLEILLERVDMWDVIVPTLLFLASAAVTLARILSFPKSCRYFIDMSAVVLSGIAIIMFATGYIDGFLSLYSRLYLFALVFVLVACLRERIIVIRYRKQRAEPLIDSGFMLFADEARNALCFVIRGAGMMAAHAAGRVAEGIGRVGNDAYWIASNMIKKSIGLRSYSLCIRHGNKVIPLAKYLREDDAIALYNKVNEVF